MSRQARLVFMGTPDFAVPSLERLAEEGYQILVVTQPDKPVGRKRELTPPPVKRAALTLGLPVLQPERVRRPEALEPLRAFEPDVLVTAAYGQLLPQTLLDIPRVGCVNVHASLLPRWRGAAPIQRAILAGDSVTGVTLMEMVLELDAGPMLAATEVPILDSDDLGTLHDKLASAGANLLAKLLPDYLAGRVTPKPQPEQGITYAERIVRRDEWIDWNEPAVQTWRRIRALSPWPGASTVADGKPLKIWRAVLADRLPELAPGTVRTPGDRVLVACADGALELLEVQPAGKRRMPASDWARGLQRQEVRLERASD